jgi:hypothetical protein
MVRVYETKIVESTTARIKMAIRISSSVKPFLSFVFTRSISTLLGVCDHSFLPLSFSPASALYKVYRNSF